MPLEATLDLAERRQIRSAIRELRRQELERDEEALASKRFRTERQENKENRLRKLETIQDVEELTSLLRGTSEYEERKLIRAAIRQLRAEEIEGMWPSKGCNWSVQNRAGEELVPSQVQEPLDPKAADDPESSSGTVLLLEAVPSHRPSELAPFPGKEASGEDPGPNSCDQDSGPEPQPSSEEEEEEEEAEAWHPPKCRRG
ncbi:hypothetical protein E2320_012511 [Naja naja]|nr:hypothetical protein E2320_012511 [Naja naja]